ncbi:hypothetical protein EYF80_048179 [Liparis tanakae]|uniref:Uncharacterized protein n=1 Tax=Liparis tanakae TaxID=230148 RepID=A0A4Z2FLI9_9TELE|nr:hypothetical protein EYF80_048179 [Liparis tanakae]
MAGVTRKGSGRPSYYYRFLGRSRLQRQRSRSRSRTRPPASRGNEHRERDGLSRSRCSGSSPWRSFRMMSSVSGDVIC